ncbi:MAG: MMPL family transporter, partial [Myxococcales bacterium]|nr:MMPL family transporter [Myxococcales bacterium]
MFLARLAAVQVRSAVRIAIVGFLIAAASMPFVMRLGLNSDWTALLPKNTPSVRDLETVRARFGGMATLTVALHSKDQAAMEKLGTHLAKEIERIGPPVRHVGWTISPYQDFVAERRHMYLSLDSLRRIRDDLQSRIDYEKLSANPFYLDLEDDKPPTLEEIVDTVKKETEGKSSEFEKYPNGFYIHPDGDLLAIFVRTYLENDDVDGSVRLMDRVQGLIDAANPTTYASDMRVDLGGDIPEALEEQRAITQELVIATSITLALVLLVVFFYFGRGRSIPLLGLALVPPVAMTFAVAEVTVDYLNTSTAFLGSIVVGNGVNPNIMWLARYFEERRSGKSPEGAVTAAHLATWAATLTASLAAAIAYASLTVTDFRGFRDFGIIGGVGMVLCWVGSIAFLPALVLVSERWKPMIFSKVATGRDWFA